MTVFGKITKNSVTVTVVNTDGALNAVQLAFDPFHMGLERCDFCGKTVERTEIDQLGECWSCFRKGME